ncbi:MAG: hypothetical protein E7375_02840 [Clostridiales bacterium]|nr:hypothetical protein [Clostridiales bacterium]
MLSNNDVLKSIAQKAKRRLVGRENNVSAKIKVISDHDEEFKSKVIYLLSQDEVVTNPIQYLMDEKVLNSLGEDERERYLFSTVDKYNTCRKEIGI